MLILIFVIDSGFLSDEGNDNCLFDLVIIDDNKVWMGGYLKELKLFDLEGNFYCIVCIICMGLFLCVYYNNVVYIDYVDKFVKMKFDFNVIVIMFIIGDWKLNGFISIEFGDFLVCF